MPDSTAGNDGVGPRQPMDGASLARWLRDNVPGLAEPLAIEQFKGGQSNPTYRLRARSGSYVLRRKPAGRLLPGAHAIEREYRVMAALAGSDVPVPRMYALCSDESVIGSAFYVMEHVEGRILWDPRLPGWAPADRGRLFDSVVATIAALHRIEPGSVGLDDFGRPGAFLARQVARWSKQYRISETETIPSMERLIEWLPAHVPPEGEARIVHGDYRLDNLVIHPTEPRVVAILDWELATIGDPVADFAYHAMSWRIPPDLFRGLAGTDLGRLGIPTESEYVRRYCELRGQRDVVDWEYAMAFSMFRVAAIVQGIAKRALDGTAADPDAGSLGRKARPLADQAWAIAQAAGAR